MNGRIKNLKKDVLVKDNSKSVIYFGTGLCTTKEMSIGVPFDFFAYMIIAEKMRQALGAGKILHGVADSHAKTNDFTDNNEVDKKADEMVKIATNIAHAMRIEDKFEVFKISSIDNTEEYKNIRDSLTHKDVHEYVKKQWTDMHYLEKNNSVIVKVSWLLDPKKKKGFDERYFDEGFSNNFKSDMSFVYALPGRTATPNKIRACPYTATQSEDRILIQTNEDVKGKIEAYQAGSKTSKTVLEHLQKIVSSYEEVLGYKLSGDNLVAKIHEMNEGALNEKKKYTLYYFFTENYFTYNRKSRLYINIKNYLQSFGC